MEGLDDRRFPALGVDFDDLALRKGVRVDFVSVSALGSMSSVVVERDDFAVTVLRDVAGMVLEAEVDIGTESKVGLLAAESPDDFTGCSVDLVDRAGVAR